MRRTVVLFAACAALLVATPLVASLVVWNPLFPQFSPPRVIDPDRPGGEPVIAVAKDGSILVGAHPSYTLTNYAPDPDLLVPANGQANLWRSTDGGDSWTFLTRTLDGSAELCPGISDPDLAVDGATGRVWFVEIHSTTAGSISASDDHGATWDCVEDQASPEGGFDRPFLVAEQGSLGVGTFTRFSRTPNGAAPAVLDVTACPGLAGDIARNPWTGRLYKGCGDALGISDDGTSWRRTARHQPAHAELFFDKVRAEPAIDAAGTVYLAWTATSRPDRQPDQIWVAWTSDDGATWRTLQATNDADDKIPDGTHIWAWVTAGSAGRFAVTWMGTAGMQSDASAWRIYTMLGEIDPVTGDVNVQRHEVTEDPVHRGQVCFSGLNCQTTTIDDCAPEFAWDCSKGDRRLGEFFETALGPEGELYIAYPDTQTVHHDVTSAFPPGVAHVMFVKQEGGIRLLAPGEEPHWYS